MYSISIVFILSSTMFNVNALSYCVPDIILLYSVSSVVFPFITGEILSILSDIDFASDIFPALSFTFICIVAVLLYVFVLSFVHVKPLSYEYSFTPLISSVAFTVIVTSPLFHPKLFASGFFVIVNIGAVVSSTASFDPIIYS